MISPISVLTTPLTINVSTATTTSSTTTTTISATTHFNITSYNNYLYRAATAMITTEEFNNNSNNNNGNNTGSGSNGFVGGLFGNINNNSNGNISTMNDYGGGGGGNPVFPNYIRTTSMVFCIIIMCLGVIGNIMVPIVIFKSKDMRNSTNIFLVNLSVADLMVLLVCTPTVLVEVNSKPETWVLGREMCKAVPFVELTVAHASVLTILAISFERYYAICKPLKASYVCTKARASLICLLAWFIAAVFTSPMLAIAEFKQVDYFDGSKVPACHTLANTFWSALYFLSTIFLFFIVPLIVLLVLYCIIGKNLMFNANSLILNKHLDNYSIRARKQVMLMLGTVVLSFFVCLVPFRVFTLWIIIVPEEYIYNLGVEKYYNILYFSRIMVYLNSAINPILYNLMSSKFRNGFLICSKNSKRNRMKNGTTYTSSTQHSSSRSSTFRNSHESYRVFYRPRTCSVLIRTSASDSAETRSIDSFRLHGTFQKNSKNNNQQCIDEEIGIETEQTFNKNGFNQKNNDNNINMNIFTEKVIICTVAEQKKDNRRILDENLDLKNGGKIDEETFV